HKKYTGSGNENILKNLNKLSELNKKVVVVLPLILNINDGDININSMVGFLNSLPNKFPLNILPYHDYYISKLNQLGRKYSKFSAPAKNQIEKIKRNFEKSGIKVIKPSSFF
ncbi:MAG: hypothetical protein M1409_10500, partial [Actinobacteria bacterium]|nr:hypothetical protein [Actinomycetota bacterium]